MSETESIQVIPGSWAKTVYGGNAIIQPQEIIQAINPHLSRMLGERNPILISTAGDEFYRDLLNPNGRAIHVVFLEAEPYLDYQQGERKFVLRPRFGLGAYISSEDYLHSSIIHCIEARYVAELLLATFPQTKQLQKIVNFFLKVDAKLQIRILISDLLMVAKGTKKEMQKISEKIRAI